MQSIIPTQDGEKKDGEQRPIYYTFRGETDSNDGEIKYKGNDEQIDPKIYWSYRGVTSDQPASPPILEDQEIQPVDYLNYSDDQYYLKNFQFNIFGIDYSYFAGFGTCVKAKTQNIINDCTNDFKKCYRPLVYEKFLNPLKKYEKLKRIVPVKFVQDILFYIQPDLSGYFGAERKEIANGIQTCAGYVLQQQMCPPILSDSYALCIQDDKCKINLELFLDETNKCIISPKVNTFRDHKKCFSDCGISCQQPLFNEFFIWLRDCMNQVNTQIENPVRNNNNNYNPHF